MEHCICQIHMGTIIVICYRVLLGLNCTSIHTCTCTQVSNTLHLSCTGIPAKPQVPVFVSNRGEQATLSLSTNAAGLSSPEDGLTFTVTATPTKNGTLKMQTMIYTSYTDGQVVMFVFTGLEPGNYMFNVTVRNQFGVSEASDNSAPFMIERKCACVCECMHVYTVCVI